MTPDDVGEYAVAHWGTGDEWCRGRVLAHSVVPQVLIETPDGERIWLRHDLARLATTEEKLAMLDALWEARG